MNAGMNLRPLFALLVLASTACSRSDDTIWSCIGACDSKLTFTLATPLSGTEIAIIVGEPDGTVDQIDCQRGAASVACVPVSARVVPTFDANGALLSLEVSPPTAGTYAVQIAVDGTSAAAGSFWYEVPPLPAHCGDPCSGNSSPGCNACPPSRTFTIAN
jgi:hypothetical protein